MTIVFQKSILKSKAAKRIVADAKLTYFKEKVLEHLDKLERKEKKREQLVQKALVEAECLRKAAYPVGTIREWKGKKYIKTAPGKWRRKYDSDSRGAKQSIAAIKRKVDKCGSVEELLEVAKQNKHRFTDENGRYLPFVREMFDYVGKKHKEIKGANAGGSASSGEGKQKTLNAAQIMQAGKNGERVRYEDIDWDALEKDKGKAQQAITKKNILGKMDWGALKEDGVEGGVVYLIKRVYDTIGEKPSDDSAGARRAYVIAINELKDRLEATSASLGAMRTIYTVKDLFNALKEIKTEMDGGFLSKRESPEGKARYAPIIEAEGKLEAAKRDVMRKHSSWYAADIEARGRVQKRVKKFLVENNAMRDGQLVQIDHLEKFHDNLSPKKINALYALKDRAMEKEGARAKELYAEYKKAEESAKEIASEYKKAVGTYKEWAKGQASVEADSNPLSNAWQQLGDKFANLLDSGTEEGKAFEEALAQAAKGKYAGWDWLKDSKAAGKNGAANDEEEPPDIPF